MGARAAGASAPRLAPAPLVAPAAAVALPALALPAGAAAHAAPKASAGPADVSIGRDAEVNDGRALPPVLGSVHDLAAQGEGRGDVPAALYDGNVRLGHDVGGAADGDFGGNGGGGSDDGSGRETPREGLGRLYPRVAFILDTFDGPAPDAVVQRVEALADKGVHVVFITARPEKGENSAESVLVARLKKRTANPVIVASYNGARIAAHNSRAENPKPLLDDLPGFPAATLVRFRDIGAAVKKKLGLRGELKEFGAPDAGAPFIYGAELPKGADAAKWAKAYNAALASAGFLYKIETMTGADGKSYFFTQSTALKLNTARLFQALYAMFPQLDPQAEPERGLRSEQVLVLANPAKSPSFLRTLDASVLPGAGFSIHGVKDAASLDAALGAVLGHNALEKVYVNRSDLKDYAAWLAARERFGAGARSGAGRFDKDVKARRLVAFYRGIIVKDLMGRLYHLIRQGQYEEASPEAAQTLLAQMWNWPQTHGVRLPAELQAARYNPQWNRLKKEGLAATQAWLRNYYKHNFRDYPRNISEKVVGSMVNLSRDGSNGVSLDYVNPHTGRRYVVGVRPDLVEVKQDDKGWLLVTHVHRTGKELFSNDFNESIEVNIVGRAALEGYAIKGADGRWYLNDEPDPRVKVVFHYLTRDLPKVFSPSELEQETPRVTALIEKRENDKDYQAMVAEREKQEEKAKAAAVRTLKRHGKAPAAKGRKGARAK